MLPAKIVCGGTYDWFLNPASINSEAAPSVFAPWDISGATVTISFINYAVSPPTSQTFTATVSNGPAGQARYINETTLFDTPGPWGVSWNVSLGGVVLESQIVNFQVYQAGSQV